jgi:hypothetical protein
VKDYTLEHDPDIAILALTHPEKAGLQLFRNYKSAFDRHAQKLFAEKVDAENHEAKDLVRVLDIILHEDTRALPIIGCAYADELRLAMYKRNLPDEVPGGKPKLFGAFGPFSAFSSKIKMAYCFDLVSADLLVDLDRIRKVRNDLSHAWDHEPLREYFGKEPVNKLFAIEELIGADQLALTQGCETLSAEAKFRVRLGWTLARFTYEANLYQRAKSERLNPRSALYGEHRPKLLMTVSKAALSFTRRMIDSSSRQTPPLV